MPPSQKALYGRTRWRLPEDLGCGKGMCWSGPSSWAHRGRALKSRGTKAQQNPCFPHASFLSPAWGGGPQLFSYLVVSRPRKGFLEPVGGSLSPSSVSRSTDWWRHPHGLSLPCSLGATRGFSRAYGYCKNSPHSQHCSSVNLCSPRWLSEQSIVGWLDRSIIGGCGTQFPPSEDVFQGMTPEPPHPEGLVPPFRALLGSQGWKALHKVSQTEAGWPASAHIGSWDWPKFLPTRTWGLLLHDNPESPGSALWDPRPTCHTGAQRTL